MLDSKTMRSRRHKAWRITLDHPSGQAGWYGLSDLCGFCGLYGFCEIAGLPAGTARKGALFAGSGAWAWQVAAANKQPGAGALPAPLRVTGLRSVKFLKICFRCRALRGMRRQAARRRGGLDREEEDANQDARFRIANLRTRFFPRSKEASSLNIRAAAPCLPGRVSTRVSVRVVHDRQGRGVAKATGSKQRQGEKIDSKEMPVSVNRITETSATVLLPRRVGE
ncbi:hypothetical protein [Bordetella genomosp. 10]|uniref:hypothetical protein n=1 Tax=Bordetella genomosp. 10 TaxID=1416804 RepID=UPI00117861EF|nr:hypothetical protein [Bordetella genomosp. 10]